MAEVDIEFWNILNRDTDKASCGLMRIGEIFILFDCGVTERLKDEDEYDADSGLKRVAEAAGKAHYIFISHPTLHHVGALPFLHKIGVMSNPELKEIFATSPVAKIGAQTMYEFAIQKKELGVFDLFSLKNVESAFEKFQLVPFGENKRIKLGNTELIVSALPSGNGIGGTAWKIEFQKQTLIYALELNDKPTQITPPFPVDRFKHANYFFTNAYLHDKQQHLRSNTNLQFVTEERLKAKVEAALLDKQSQILIPCSSKNKILALMLLFENMFKSNQRLQQAAQTTKLVQIDPQLLNIQVIKPTINAQGQVQPMTKEQQQKLFQQNFLIQNQMIQSQQVQTVIEPIVIYLEHMSKETLDVAKSHTSWMNFKDNSQFQDIEQNPCNFSYVKTITKLEEYKERAFNADGTAKPLIILTSVSSMNQGYARALLKDFAAEKKNEIVFVEIQNAQVPKESVAAKLLQKLIYFVIDNVKATSVVEKPVKAFNDPRTRKTETAKRKTPIEELIETTAKLTDTESKQSKDTTASVTNGQHQNTIAEDQLEHQNEALKLKRLEKFYFKSFARDNQFPLFSFGGHTLQGQSFFGERKQQLSLYGHKKPEKVETLNDNSLVDLMNAQEREENKQAVSNVITEKAHIESYNRFRELQKQYSLPFNYSTSKSEIFVRCQISYLPYECRIDKVSFELMLLQTQPKNLVILNSSVSKVNEIQQFCEANHIETQLFSSHADNKQVAQFTTNSSVKQVFLDNNLLKSMAVQKIVHKRFEVARIYGQITPSLDNQLIFDELHEPSVSKSVFERKSLFLMSKEYKLIELQQFLAQQHIQTLLLDQRLNYDDKIFVFLDKTTRQIKLEGFICPEYFAIRKLIYSHFARI